MPTLAGKLKGNIKNKEGINLHNIHIHYIRVETSLGQINHVWAKWITSLKVK